MTKGKNYRVKKRIKLHTSPLVMADAVNEGIFVKETGKSYVFDSFRVSKSCFVSAEELRGADND
jgi:hypothetical protein